MSQTEKCKFAEVNWETKQVNLKFNKSKQGIQKFKNELAVYSKNKSDHFLPIIKHEEKEIENVITIPTANASFLDLTQWRLAKRLNYSDGMIYYIAKCVLEGLLYLKEKLNRTHQDVKIDNIVYHDGKYKLIDFSESIDLNDKTIQEIDYANVNGTDLYDSPEKKRKGSTGSVPISEAFKNDVYSLGILILFLLEGRFKISLTSPTTANNRDESKNNETSINALKERGFNKKILSLLTQMLEKNYEKRISLEECKKEFDALFENKNILKEIEYETKASSAIRGIKTSRTTNFEEHILMIERYWSEISPGKSFIQNRNCSLKLLHEEESFGYGPSFTRTLIEVFKWGAFEDNRLSIAFDKEEDQNKKEEINKEILDNKNYLKNKTNILANKNEIITYLKECPSLTQYIGLLKDGLKIFGKISLRTEDAFQVSNYSFKESNSDLNNFGLKHYYSKPMIRKFKNRIFGTILLLLTILALIMGFYLMKASSKDNCLDTCNGYCFRSWCLCEKSFKGRNCEKTTNSTFCNPNFINPCGPGGYCSRTTNRCQRKNDTWSTIEQGTEGLWFPEVEFKENHFLCGIKIYLFPESPSFQDSVGLGELTLTTCDIKTRGSSEDIRDWGGSLIKKEDRWYRGNLNCGLGNFITGIRVYSEKKIKGLLGQKVGICGLEIKCSNENDWKIYNQYSDRLCEWRKPFILEPDYLICGANIRITPPRGRTVIGPYFGNIVRSYLNLTIKRFFSLEFWNKMDAFLDEDDSGLTGLEFKKCKIQNL